MTLKRLFIPRILILLGLASTLSLLTMLIPALILAQGSIASGIGILSNGGFARTEADMTGAKTAGFIAGAATTAIHATQVISIEATACITETLAYWKFDETSGPSYDDFQSNHDAQCAGVCPASLAKGWVNGAQTFNGTSTGIDVPAIPNDNSFNWDKNESFSIELWMKGVPGKTCAVSGIPNNEVIIGRDDKANSPLHWWVGCTGGTGAARFQLEDTTGSNSLLEGPAINDGAWHHLVGVRDGASNVNRLYVDGVEVDSAVKVYTTGFTSATAALNIGWLNRSGGFHFEGVIDEVAIYHKSLSVSEIQAHYNNGVPGPGYCGGLFAPRITSNPNISAEIGQSYTYSVVAVGSPVPTYTLDITPLGMTIDPTTGVISWLPTPVQQGFHSVQVRASNSEGTDIQLYTVGVGVKNVYLPLIFKGIQ